LNEQFANNEVGVIRTIDYRFLKHEDRIDSTFFCAFRIIILKKIIFAPHFFD